jgi:hypothetical protein
LTVTIITSPDRSICSRNTRSIIPEQGGLTDSAGVLAGAGLLQLKQGDNLGKILDVIGPSYYCWTAAGLKSIDPEKSYANI